jgi:predicted O-methyltransferase YrrM
MADAARRLRLRAVQAVDVTERFRSDVVARGEFEHDWFTVHIPAWDAALRELEGQQARLLELGSFEGLSACFLLWRLPDAHLTCVDSFDGFFSSAELEHRFERNVAMVDAARVRKLTGKTRDVLPRLLNKGARFDFIYIDASHNALDVLADAALAWQLLDLGGLCAVDDYGLDRGDPMLSPTAAIDAFLSVVASEAERVPGGRQLFVRKKTG